MDPSDPTASSSSQDQGNPTPGKRTEPLTRVEAWCLSLVSLVQASALGWAAFRLPWTVWTTFSGATLLAAFAHAALSVSALGWPTRALCVFRLSAWASLLLLVVVTVRVVHGGAYLIAVYGSLGEGLTAATLAIWALFFLFTGPTAIWGLVRSRGHGPRMAGRWGVPLVSTLTLLGLVAYAANTYSGEKLRSHLAPLGEQELAGLVTSRGKNASSREPARPVSLNGISECADGPLVQGFTLFITTASALELPPSGNTERRCFRGSDRAQVIASARHFLSTLQSPGPVVLDWVVGARRIDRLSGFLSSLVLRPGLDGLCFGGRCLLPWQLLARGDFAVHRPLDFVADLKFGADLEPLKRELLPLRDPAPEPELLSFESQNVVIRDGHHRELRRLRPVLLPELERAEGQAALAQASKLAQAHILGAQEKDGRFRYVLDPFTGSQRSEEFSLPRQAGTLLALCELGERTEAVDGAIARGLAFLKRKEIVFGEGRLSALAPESAAKRLWVSDSALPLVAFARCRPRVGEKHDTTIRRLAAFLSEMQAPDGTFRPEYRFKNSKSDLGPTRLGKGAVVNGVEPLFVSGQAVLAFVLLQKDVYAPSSISREQVRNAAQVTMDHVAFRHWDHGLSPFFFIEENWHCLAAREALEVQRHDLYEDFCLDFMRFKLRVILTEEEGTPIEFVGGHGFGSIVPPHNTATSGFAESMAAAIAVKNARGEDWPQARQALKRAMAFILRQQWTPDNAFACQKEALGSFSEQTHIPEVRIDFVQHAWAGLGHGREALAL